MRIIDKNTDFYDFYQNVYKDDTLTFDRRDSYILTKEMICNKLSPVERWWNWKRKKDEPDRHTFLLLQICNNFWLFLIKITDIDDWGKVKDYQLKLVESWKDFDRPRTLCSLKEVRFHFYYGESEDYIFSRLADARRDVHTNHYKIKATFDYMKIRVGDTEVERHIPLLKACGIGNLLDAHEVYLAFEEYFSLEKTDSERREPIGTTDIDKIESHGFDKKSSFRGK